MKNINESNFFDSLIDDNATNDGANSILSDIGSGRKKKNKKSKVNDIPQQIPQQIPQIKKVQTIEELVQQNVQQQAIKSVKEKNTDLKKKKAKSTIKKLGKKKELVQQNVQQKVQEAIVEGKIVSETEKQQLTQELKQKLENDIQVGQVTPDDIVNAVEILEDNNNVSLDNVNTIEVLEDVGAALENIPDGVAVDIDDIEIIPSKTRKDKTGYFKTKVNIKKSNIPPVINTIASYVKQHTKGLISPRVCDLRVIGNTNKTQLRNSSLKLSVNTIVFKPDHTKLKVNKGTRFMISIPEDYESTGNLLVYIQESRAKTILELTAKDFPNQDVFNEFLGDRIAEYYYHGYDVTLKKLQLRGADNLLMPIISMVLNTQDYKAKPYCDDDNHLYAVDFISKGTENQWLTIQIIESEQFGKYDLKATSKLGIEFDIKSEPVTLQWLNNNTVELLNKLYARDWSKELENDGLDASILNMNKLNHLKLREAYYTMFGLMESEPDLGLEILGTLSRRDMLKLKKTDYDAEAIIGKTNFCEFVLTYLAYPIVGGDKRKGREYITRQQYYNKYSVSDRRNYQQREKTILKKEGNERNYNARIYLFQLEFRTDKNKKYTIYRSKKFEDVVSITKFLTNVPNVNITSQY